MSELDLRDTFGNYLVNAGKLRNDIVVLDADLSASTRTFKFAKAFPRRFFNMGIAEQNMVGTAIGLAISGKVPVVSGFSVFTTGRAWEFIRLACHDNLNMKIITTHSGIVGEDGSTHNALEDLSLMATLPNLTILIPSDNIELEQILEYVFNIVGTCYVRLPRGSLPLIHNKNYTFSIGKPDILKKGKDICLIGTGYGSILAFQLAPKIEEKLNISIKVINFPCIKPINSDALIKEVKNTKGIVILEEHNFYCGFGSIISRIFSEYFPLPMRFIGVQDTFIPSGKTDILLDSYGFNEETLINQVESLLDTK
jgi:transketolase